MKITIVTPCLNSGHLLARTCESIYSQTAVLNGRCELQHIICDGASEDDTQAVVTRFPRSEFYSETDDGMYSALAKGLQRASGQIVGYLNAGDSLFPWAFDVLLQIFVHKGVEWVTGYASVVNREGQVTASWSPPRYRREFVTNGFYALPSYPACIQQESTFWLASLNKSVDFSKLRRLRLAGDYFIWTEFAKKTELHSVASPLGAFLLHKNQLSEMQDRYLEEVSTFVCRPSLRDRFTAWWETQCNPVFKSSLWRYTHGKSKASVFMYNKDSEKWVPQ